MAEPRGLCPGWRLAVSARARARGSGPVPPPSPVTTAWQGRVFPLTLCSEGNSSPNRCDEVAPGLPKTPPGGGVGGLFLL